MKLIYKGKYSGDPETIPHGQHKENAVKFKEYDDLAKFGIVMNLAAIVFMCFLPNIVFGFIPFSAFLINPDLTFLGTIVFVSIAMGMGDYYNAFNALM
ncbi:MAG: hypothetical protein LUE12_00705 [Ruminococcus sp.]|nr:hypothetical protein [Ruminococcus sp.]